LKNDEFEIMGKQNLIGMNEPHGLRANSHFDVQAVFARLRPAVVAIDGPGASGKSTIGHLLAERANYLFFDTGVMYRAVTWAALQRGRSVDDEAAMEELATLLDIDISAPAVNDGRHCTVLVDGRDVTWAIRTPAVDQSVSAVSAYPGVRRALSAQQRRIGRRYGLGTADKAGIVMVGRDIGTVVMPEAPLKIFMDASPDERARRRFAEMQGRGRLVVYEEILQDLLSRDRLDRERAYSPLRVATDAVVVDTSNLTPDEVVARIAAIAEARLASGR
jgi:cytidylate kinase